MAITKEKGKIVVMGAIAQGTSQRGNTWQRQQVVFEVAYGNSVRRVAANAATDMVVELGNYKVGDFVEFGYVCSAREWQGKWYAQCDLLSIGKNEGGKAQAPAADNGENDLPF